jgi:hypothetical protein
VSRSTRPWWCWLTGTKQRWMRRWVCELSALPMLRSAAVMWPVHQTPAGLQYSLTIMPLPARQ